jgi:CBS domain-containing protein
VDESMALLLSRGLSGAPVVDNTNDQRLVGMLTSFDFLQQEAFEGVLLPMEGSLEHVEMYVQAAQRICGQQVADVMTYNPEKITMDTPMRTAAALMTRKRLHRLPVVDTNSGGRLVGILSCSNVMKDLLHIVRTLPPSATATSAAASSSSPSPDAVSDNGNEK